MVGERLNGKAVRRLQSLVLFCGFAVLATACLVLFGYALGFPILATVRPGLRALSVMSAFGLMLLAIATLACLYRRRRLGLVMEVVAVLLGAAMLVSHAIQGDDVISPPLTTRLFGTAPGLQAAPRSPRLLGWSWSGLRWP